MNYNQLNTIRIYESILILNGKKRKLFPTIGRPILVFGEAGMEIYHFTTTKVECFRQGPFMDANSRCKSLIKSRVFARSQGISL